MCLACAALSVTETAKMRRHLIMSSDAPAVIGRSRAANMYVSYVMSCTGLWLHGGSPGHMRACVRACVRRRPDAVGDRDPFCSLRLSGVEQMWSSLDESRLGRDRDGPEPPLPHSWAITQGGRGRGRAISCASHNLHPTELS